MLQNIALLIYFQHLKKIEALLAHKYIEAGGGQGVALGCSPDSVFWGGLGTAIYLLILGPEALGSRAHSEQAPASWTDSNNKTHWERHDL